MDDGGPAFPHQDSGDTGMRSGMTLRDWFAGQALANPFTASETDCNKVAEWAYLVADAMLVARNAKGDDNG